MTRREMLQDAYEDALMALLMEGAAEERGQRLLTENERLKSDPAFAGPAGLDEKIAGAVDRALRRERGERAKKTALRVLPRALVAAVAAALLFTGAFAASERARTEDFWFLSDVNFEQVELRVFRSGDAGDPDPYTDFKAKWLPEGYACGGKREVPLTVYRTYEGPEGGILEIGLHTLGWGMSYIAGTMDSAVMHLEIEGNSAWIIEHRDGGSVLIISLKETGQVLDLTDHGGVPVEDMMRIAENIVLTR